MIKTNIYLYEINDFNKLYEVDSFFSTYRLNKIAASNNEKIINRMILTEYMLKHILELELNRKVEKIEIETKNINKPYLKNINKYFNITHKDNLILIGISNNDLGLDIEKIDSKREKISKKLYNNNNNYPINKIIKDFTVKEAYIKYYGLSILTNMKIIEILNNQVKGPQGLLNFQTFKYNNYYISLTQKTDFNVSFYKIDEEFTKDLLKYNKYIKICKSEEEK